MFRCAPKLVKHVTLLGKLKSHTLRAQHGREVMKETDQSIERSKAVVQETIQIGQTTAEALKGQTKQMEKIVDDLDEIHFSMKKTAKIIKDITRGVCCKAIESFRRNLWN